MPGPKPDVHSDHPHSAEQIKDPDTAPTRDADRPAGGFPEPRGKDPGDRSRDAEPHHALNNPVEGPDETEWPDPYDHREDPLEPDPEQDIGDEAHPPTGAESTSAPHPADDIEGDSFERHDRERQDL